MRIATVLLAAGSSSRMEGRDKLMERVGDQPLLHLMAVRALAAGGPVIVALPDRNSPFGLTRWDCVEGLDVLPVSVPDASEGMNASLRTTIAGLPPVDAAMILLADLPELTADDLRTMKQAITRNPDHPIWRATDTDGRPGHPVAFSATLFPDLLALTGDTGAQSIVRAHKDQVHLIPLPGSHATLDLDTPEAWDTWRNR
ncbi:nucleotidyltransferase family protein [Chachezhania antarctica]|uniref:nucleotidyltransferase family protein n=1 Tax=Chachezhania antarctica TaxID=2340860 RepID=UPI000EB572B2|nr:nucleotidyltransferase family protein [Chachezhania antarctica]|tara:strand:+ start:158 stop:757 length:600 start_codon:yes stop_codon:yes gene_type:complete